MAGDLVIDHIGELLTVGEQAKSPLAIAHDATVIIKDGVVRYAGTRSERPTDVELSKLPAVDAKGALVTPGLIDPHTHAIFAGSRAGEFDLRAQGKTYPQIQAAGGGIFSTVRATRAASDEELIASTKARLNRFLAAGVTTVEAKSGYDLTIAGELRLLRLLNQVGRNHPVAISPTLLAHAPPFDQDRGAFIDQFVTTAIPQAAREALADAVDVYCDAGAFTLDETRRILAAAKAQGLALRVHAEQFTHTGAADLAADLGARSVEHLEELGDTTPAKLAQSNTVCDLLPGAALTLKLRFPDAGKLIAAGCLVALGTDCNPGSSLSESLPLMMSLACMQMGMSVADAWLAVTRNAAIAVGRSDRGSLSSGMRGDVVIWQADDYRQVVQHFGVPLVEKVVVAGRPVYGAI